jgi:hypothetical protein
MSQLVSGRPDAVLVPERLKHGGRSVHRVDSILAIAGPLLGVVWGRGDRAYFRRQLGITVDWPQEHMVCFCVRSLLDTVNYDKSDTKGRQGCRYRWEPLDGLRIGYLKDPSDREIQC